MGSSSSSLYDAVCEGNHQKVSKILQKKYGDRNKLYNRETVLFRAVKDNNEEMVKQLLHYNVNINVFLRPRLFNGSNTAASLGNENDDDSYVWSAVHEAAKQGNPTILLDLLMNGGNKDLSCDTLLPPLHIAAWFDHPDCVKVLTDEGCDVNKLDCFNESALVIPICMGNTRMVEQLLYSGCSMGSRSWGNLRKTYLGIGGGRWREEYSAFNTPGSYSLLSLTVLRMWPHLAILLLQHGYDPSRCELYALVRMLQFSLKALGEFTSRQVILCYLAAAGHTPRPRSDAQLMDNLQLPPNQGFDTDSLEWIKAQLGMDTVTLQQLCRNSIRGTMRKFTNNASIMSRLKQLGDILPQSIVDYLTLAEFSTDADDLPTFRRSNQEVTGLLFYGYIM